MDIENFLAEYKGVVIAGVAVIVLGIILLINFLVSTKNLTFKTPGEPITITAGETYQISWSSRNVGRIGLVLFKGDDPQWIVQNYPAGAGKYDWTPFVYQAAGADYRIAMFQYPWREGNPIVYSPYQIEIVGPQYSSCDSYSIKSQWPYLPENYVNLHRVFITNGSWTGSMGGLEGADAKCAKEADDRGYPGTYVAFIGDDEVAASERIKVDGVFVEVEGTDKLAEGIGCHRMIASGLKDFLDKTRLSGELADVELGESFLRKLRNVWYGRRTPQVDSKCLALAGTGLTSAFSGTYTCQDWTNEGQKVYSGEVPDEAELPRCYDSAGNTVFANYFGAAASTIDDSGQLGVGGDTCDVSRSLICIEQ